jgi:CubicO group peptidase (beta-lactamase class C family)
LYDPYVTEDLTVEDLLCHRSGLITFDGDLLWYGTNYTQKEAVERIRNRPPSLPFRAGFGYQNLMYMTAGEVIEAVSGLDWHTFVAQRILNPLGMSRTTSSYEAFIADNNMAMPHLKGDEIGTLSYHNSGATAALNSCTHDMSRWLSFWINDGIVDGDTLIQPTTIKKIWSLHTPLGVGRFDEQNGTHFKGYGLGWFLMDYKGLKVVHHGGGLPGYITKAAIVPEKDLGIIVLTNDMSSASSMMMYAVIDAFEGRDYEHWTETFLNFKQQSAKREEEALDARLESKSEQPKVYEEEAYSGKYQDKMYGEASVEVQNGSLTLTFKPAKELFSGKLSAWGDHQFRWDHRDPFLTYGLVQFHVEDNRVIGFSIDLPNDDFHFDKLDFKKVN